MQRGFLYSLFLHIILILGFLVKFQFFEKTKKVNYQRFSINVVMKQKDNSKANDVAISQKKEIKQPIEKAEKTEQPKENKIERVKEENLKVEKEKPKEIKKVEEQKSKIEEPKKKEVEAKETKKNIKPIIDNTKKEKKKVNVKKENDVFSKLLSQKDVESFNAQMANLADSDLAIIKEQIAQHWIKTPCPNHVKIELEIVINSSCHIISRNIDMKKYVNSSQTMACANSAFRATQQCDKLDLEVKKCQELNGKIILLNFHLDNV